MQLRNAGGVRGVTMVPEADGDDSRHCELWRGRAGKSRGQQGLVGDNGDASKYPPGTAWSVRRYLRGTATRGYLDAVIGRGI